jgi:phosphoglycerate dehydrogenase-like enzyme
MMNLPVIAVLDDSQHVAMDSADWSALRARAEIRVFNDPIGDVAATARALADVDIIIPMRERTAFTAALIAQLPNLKMIALTGARAPTLDLAACAARGIVVSNTGGGSVGSAAPELAFGLILSLMRHIPAADSAMKESGWHEGVGLGKTLAGQRLGIVGLGKLGQRVARYAKAFDMDVVAWSQNLTQEMVHSHGVTLVSKEELFATSDIVSLHLVLSERSRGIVGQKELAAMKRGACLINTARGPLVDEALLLAALSAGHIRAGLDVFDIEPLPADHLLRGLPNVVLTPHLGYSTRDTLRVFYRESIENVIAFLDGKPIRVISP